MGQVFAQEPAQRIRPEARDDAMGDGTRPPSTLGKRSHTRTVWNASSAGAVRLVPSKPDALPYRDVSKILKRAFHTLSADWAPPTAPADLLVHALEGLEPGAYRLQGSRIEPLSRQLPRGQARSLPRTTAGRRRCDHLLLNDRSGRNCLGTGAARLSCRPTRSRNNRGPHLPWRLCMQLRRDRADFLRRQGPRVLQDTRRALARRGDGSPPPRVGA